MYAPFCFWADPVVLGSTEILLKYPTCEQSHFREVPRWEIFMEQELDLGWIWAEWPTFLPSYLQNLLTYEIIIYLK
jgi:hypothetical protein